jgi:CHAT domain-containing protein
MKNVAFIAVVLCSLLIGCPTGDTDAPELWRHTVPRLSGRTNTVPCEETLRPGRVVAESRCGIRKSVFPCVASEIEKDPAETLVTRPHCADDVVAEFRRRAVLSPEAWADLAAAYYFRAQNNDDVADLLEAYDAAREAVLRVPGSREGHFNLALAQQQLAMNDEAKRSWQNVLRLEPASSPWHAFAQKRLAALNAPVPTFDAQAFENALAKGDAAAAARLIQDVPAAAMRHFEFVLLPRWSAARTPQAFAEARLCAMTLARRFKGDPFPIDIVNALIRTNRPDQLRQGHAVYGNDPAVAARLLQSGGSPLALRAEQRFLATNAIDAGEQDVAMIEALLRRTKRYVRLSGDLHSSHGFALWGMGHYAAAIAAYDSAARTYVAVDDQAKQCENGTRSSGTWRLAGKVDVAMREAVRAARCASHASAGERSAAFGEAAHTALALNQPHAALAYINGAIEAGEGLSKAVAYRERAAIRLALKQFAAAEDDLELAVATDRKIETDDAASMQARRLELQAYVTGNLDYLNKAIDASAGQHSTFTALLLTKRAALRTGAEAEADLEMALAIIHREEVANLTTRKPGEHERIWSAYFNRFRDTYDALVQMSMDAGNERKAFAYSERMRGFDLLDLILRRPDVPEAFRKLTTTVENMQAHLPEGTVIVEYMNLEDRTIVWIIGRDRFESFPLRVRRDQIERWKKDVLRYGAGNSAERYTQATHAPYAELIEPVLRVTGPVERLVIVPDEAMQGFPFAAMKGDATPWLAQRVLLEHAPSATLYVYSLLQNRALWQPGLPSMLLIGNPTTDPLFDEEPLPEAELEVADIKKMSAGNAVTTLIRDEPTKERFLKEAARHTIVHIATHTMIHQAHPEESVILLAHESIGVRELLEKLQLHQTRLFLLSSCQSAGGMRVGPEGVAPLVRPLLAAGVPAIVGSVWNVDDNTARQFGVSFHRHYRDSNDAAVALRAAQLELIRQGTPVLTWAPFLMIGHHATPAANEMTMKGKMINDQFHSPDSLQWPDGVRPQ